MDREDQSIYDFRIDPGSWCFTGEIRQVDLSKRWWFGKKRTRDQWIFQKLLKVHVRGGMVADKVRIGVIYDDGRLIIGELPQGEG